MIAWDLTPNRAADWEVDMNKPDRFERAVHRVETFRWNVGAFAVRQEDADKLLRAQYRALRRVVKQLPLGNIEGPHLTRQRILAALERWRKL